MRELLLPVALGDRVVIEANPYDVFWGIGLGANGFIVTKLHFDNKKKLRGKSLHEKRRTFHSEDKGEPRFCKPATSVAPTNNGISEINPATLRRFLSHFFDSELPSFYSTRPDYMPGD